MVSILAFAASEKQIISSVNAPDTMTPNRSDGQRIIDRDSSCRLRVRGTRQRSTVNLRSVWAHPPAIAWAPPAPIAAVEAKKADVVPVAMVAMDPMAVPYAAHADHPARVTDVTSPKPGGANVTSADTATDRASAEATTTEAAAHTTAEAATAMTATAMTAAHEHQQTALCTQIGVIGIDRLREGCRGRKSNRKSADDTKREDAAFHDCTSHGHLHDKFIAPPQAIAGHLQLATDPPPSGFFLRSMQAKLRLWLAKLKPKPRPAGRGSHPPSPSARPT